MKNENNVGQMLDSHIRFIREMSRKVARMASSHFGVFNSSNFSPNVFLMVRDLRGPWLRQRKC